MRTNPNNTERPPSAAAERSEACERFSMTFEVLPGKSLPGTRIRRLMRAAERQQLKVIRFVDELAAEAAKVTQGGRAAAVDRDTTAGDS